MKVSPWSIDVVIVLSLMYRVKAGVGCERESAVVLEVVAFVGFLGFSFDLHLWLGRCDSSSCPITCWTSCSPGETEADEKAIAIAKAYDGLPRATQAERSC